MIDTILSRFPIKHDKKISVWNQKKYISQIITSQSKEVNLKTMMNKSPKGHIAHLSHIDNNFNQQVAAYGIKDLLSSLIQTIES